MRNVEVMVQIPFRLELLDFVFFATNAVFKTVMITTSNLVNLSPPETVVEGRVVELS